MPSSNRQTHALRTFLLLVHCIILHWEIKKHSWLMTSAKTTEQCRSPQVTTILTAVASPELVANNAEQAWRGCAGKLSGRGVRTYLEGCSRLLRSHCIQAGTF